MNWKQIINFFTKKPDQRDYEFYQSQVDLYKDMDLEELRSRLIHTKAKCEYQKNKFAFFVVLVLFSFISGLTNQLFAFINRVVISGNLVDNTQQAIFWLVMFYLVVIVFILLFSWQAIYNIYCLNRDTLILEMALSLRDEKNLNGGS